ncbi:MAG: hypothetical protein ACKOOI_00610 [Pirellula sp.]
MRTPEEIADKVAEAIRGIYLRPTNYAPHSDVERLLIHYHWFWAVIQGRELEWDELWHRTYIHEHANAGIWSRHRDRHPDLTDDEVLAYTLGVWRELSLAMNVPIADHAS